MPFCPQCKYEYEDNIQSCPDCKKQLVDRLKEETDIPNIHMVPLPGLPGKVYAEMVREVLRQEGIPCYLRSDGLMDSIGLSGTGPVNRGVRIFVPEDAVDACLDIQKQMMNGI